VHLLTADNHLVKEANIHPGILSSLIAQAMLSGILALPEWID